MTQHHAAKDNPIKRTLRYMSSSMTEQESASQESASQESSTDASAQITDITVNIARDQSSNLQDSPCQQKGSGSHSNNGTPENPDSEVGDKPCMQQGLKSSQGAPLTRSHARRVGSQFGFRGKQFSADLENLLLLAGNVDLTAYLLGLQRIQTCRRREIESDISTIKQNIRLVEQQYRRKRYTSLKAYSSSSDSLRQRKSFNDNHKSHFNSPDINESHEYNKNKILSKLIISPVKNIPFLPFYVVAIVNSVLHFLRSFCSNTSRPVLFFDFIDSIKVEFPFTHNPYQSIDTYRHLNIYRSVIALLTAPLCIRLLHEEPASFQHDNGNSLFALRVSDNAICVLAKAAHVFGVLLSLPESIQIKRHSRIPNSLKKSSWMNFARLVLHSFVRHGDHITRVKAETFWNVISPLLELKRKEFIQIPPALESRFSFTSDFTPSSTSSVKAVSQSPPFQSSNTRDDDSFDVLFPLFSQSLSISKSWDAKCKIIKRSVNPSVVAEMNLARIKVIAGSMSMDRCPIVLI